MGLIQDKQFQEFCKKHEKELNQLFLLNVDLIKASVKEYNSDPVSGMIVSFIIRAIFKTSGVPKDQQKALLDDIKAKV